MNPITDHPFYKVHSIDSAMNSLWNFYKQKFMVLFPISLVMSLIIQFASTLVDFRELQSITDPQLLMSKLSEYIWPIILITILNLLFFTILHHYILFNPIEHENNILTSSVRSLRFFIPYLIIMVFLTFFSSIVLFLGLLIIIIGIIFSAIYLATIYLFILPILMIEGPNIGNTISRTLTLTHRNFWQNMGWTAVIIIILLVVSVILSGLVLLPFTGSFIKVFTTPGDPTPLLDVATNPWYILLTSVVNALAFPVLPIFACLLYLNGRAREDNVAKSDESDIYDTSGKVTVDDLYAKPQQDETSHENKNNP